MHTSSLAITSSRLRHKKCTSRHISSKSEKTRKLHLKGDALRTPPAAHNSIDYKQPLPD